MIKQANENEIPVIEEILLDAVQWLSACNMQNTWNESNTKWISLSKTFNIYEFYIAYENGVPAACMALTDHDSTFWPEIPKGQSLYLHKVAVKREFSGKGYSKKLIDFAKKSAVNSGFKSVRLNCNQHRAKLRALYENEGFVLVEEKTFFENHDTALYCCKLYG